MVSEHGAQTAYGIGGYATQVQSDTDRNAYLNGYSSCAMEEAAYQVPCVEGKVPLDLKGTYFRNGHARFEDRAGKPIRHEFDGDGFLCAFTIQNGEIVARQRWVKTEMDLAEKAAGQSLFTRTFGNPKPFWDGGLNIKNVANTGVVEHRGKLLALWEGGRPHEIDPITLETLGETTLGGIIGSGQTDSFSAHPRRCPQTETLVNFAYFGDPISGKTPVKFWEFNDELQPSSADAGKPFALRKPVLETSVPGFAMLHDMLVTENYYILLNAPCGFGGKGLDKAKNMWSLVSGKIPVGAMLEYFGGSTSLHLIPRNGGQEITVKLDEFFAFHHSNAYQEGDVLTVETVCYQMAKGMGFLDPNPQPGMTRPQQEGAKTPAFLTRFTINLKTGQFKKQKLCNRNCEFPVINPKFAGSRHRYTFMLTGVKTDGSSAGAQGLLKVDGQDAGRSTVWLPLPHQFCQEPMFVQREGATDEDDGYIMLQLFDGRKVESELLIFDARKIEAGPISRSSMRSAVPFGLHGTWVQGLCPSLQEIQDAEEKAVFLGD